MSAAIQISVRELHARTGHYVRKAATKQRVIVTDHGKPIAELTPLAETSAKPYFARRVLSPGFKKMADAGAFRPKPGTRDITDLISEDRDGD